MYVRILVRVCVYREKPTVINAACEMCSGELGAFVFQI